MVFATALTLTAAGLHATWNLLLKTAPATDRDLTSWGLFVVGGLLSIPVVIALGGPGMTAVPWLLLSGIVHVAYILGLVGAYRHGDFSLAYPLARGGGALVAAIAGAVFLGDHLALPAWFAIAVVAVGLVSLVGRGVLPVTVRDALVTASAIGTYTVIDAHGARVSADALAYGFASTAAAASCISLVFLARGRGRALTVAWPSHRGRWLTAGAASALAYALVVVATRHAPVGYVAMLRESSVVVGAFVGWRFLGEALGGRRLVSASVILVGLLILVAVTV